jgi:hypothetical protein
MSKLVTLIAPAVVSVALAAPSLARDGGHHEIRDRDDYHHGFRGGVFLYDPAYAYLYAQSGYWYLCPTPMPIIPISRRARCLGSWCRPDRLSPGTLRSKASPRTQ